MNPEKDLLDFTNSTLLNMTFADILDMADRQVIDNISDKKFVNISSAYLKEITYQEIKDIMDEIFDTHVIEAMREEPKPFDPVLDLKTKLMAIEDVIATEEGQITKLTGVRHD